MSTFLEVHVLQWLPLSCVNRDDAGLPKSMPLGGERRARWSSQSQKYALRRAFAKTLDAENLCMKTRRLPLMAVEVLDGRGRDPREAAERTVAAMAALGLALNTTKEAQKEAEVDGVTEPVENEESAPAFGSHLTGRTQVILPVTQHAHEALADAVEEHWDALGGHVDLTKDAKGKFSVPAATRKVVEQSLRRVLDVDRLVDIALFGRFLAEVPNGNVDGTCSVAHAFTTHPDDYVSEFWSAVDDNASAQGHAGSANMGTQGLTSGTFYRYAVVDLDGFGEGVLADDPALVRAGAEAFVKEFARLRPRAMVHGTAPYVDPSLVVVTVSPNPRMLGDAFVRPVEGEDYLFESAQRLADTWDASQRGYGDEVSAFALTAHPDLEDVVLENFTRVESLDALVTAAMEVAFDA